MPYIENISRSQIEKGDHWNKGQDSVLIQIIDPGKRYPKPNSDFLEVFQFEIADFTDRWHDYNDPKVFNSVQAAAIVKILANALDNKRNVTIHCNMGASRSAAVTTIGSFLGFQRRDNYKEYPNERMLKLMEMELHENYRDYI